MIEEKVVDVDTLNPGDTVIVARSNVTGKNRYVLTRAFAISPVKGVVTTEVGWRFNRQGWRYEPAQRFTQRLLQATPEAVAEIRRQTLLDKISEVKWEEVATPILELIVSATEKRV